MGSGTPSQWLCRLVAALSFVQACLNATHPAKKEGLSLAFFVGVGPGQCEHAASLLDALYIPGGPFVYAVHYDLKITTRDRDPGAPGVDVNLEGKDVAPGDVAAYHAVREKYAKKGNVVFMRRQSVTWGGVSLVLNALDAFETLLKNFPAWDYVLHVDGASYPLVPPAMLPDVLQAVTRAGEPVNHFGLRATVKCCGGLPSFVGVVGVNPVDNLDTGALLEKESAARVAATRALAPTEQERFGLLAGAEASEEQDFRGHGEGLRVQDFRGHGEGLRVRHDGSVAGRLSARVTQQLGATYPVLPVQSLIKGSQWTILSRRAAEYSLSSDARWLLAFMSTMKGPEELFFSTLFWGNYSHRYQSHGGGQEDAQEAGECHVTSPGCVLPDHLRYIAWPVKKWLKPRDTKHYHPGPIGLGHKQRLMQSGALFARKFTKAKSARLQQWLDTEVLPGGAGAAGGGKDWQRTAYLAALHRVRMATTEYAIGNVTQLIAAAARWGASRGEVEPAEAPGGRGGSEPSIHARESESDGATRGRGSGADAREAVRTQRRRRRREGGLLK